MNRSKIYNLTDKLIRGLNHQERINILLAYVNLCKNIDVDKNNIYFVRDANKPTPTDLKYMSSFITICKNLECMYKLEEDVSAWFRRHKSIYPFNGSSPLQLIQSGKGGLLIVRFYTNAGRTKVEHDE